MSRYYNRFWVIFTVVLCAVFAVLFFPVINNEYGLTKAALLTLAGIAVIWIVYFVRANVFTSMEKDKEA